MLEPSFSACHQPRAPCACCRERASLYSLTHVLCQAFSEFCHKPCMLQAPSEIRGKPVDDIISEWNSELERRSRAFVRHAEALAEWDKHILRNRHALLGLEQQLKQVTWIMGHACCTR